MNPREIPVVSSVFEAGADDRVFDTLLLLGPVVIGLIVGIERLRLEGSLSLVAEALAVAYISVFVAYVLYQGLQKRRAG